MTPEKRVRLTRGARVGLGTETRTAFNITVNGVMVGIAYEKGGIYSFKDERFTRARLVATLKGN